MSYDVQKKARELIDSFPVKLNDDITLYLIDEDVEIERVFYKNGKPNKYKYIFNIIDNYGYRNNIPLKLKPKEEYRLKLNKKREMFERNDLEYLILLKDEMNEDTYNKILKKYMEDAA